MFVFQKLAFGSSDLVTPQSRVFCCFFSPSDKNNCFQNSFELTLPLIVPKDDDLI